MGRPLPGVLLVSILAAWVYGCDRPISSEPEQTASPPERSPPAFGNVPTDPIPCYLSGMAVQEAAMVYGDAAEEAAKCLQDAEGPCEVELQAYIVSWSALSTAHEQFAAECGGSPPPGNQAPEAGWVSLEPHFAYSGSILRCSPHEFSDPDGDELVYVYIWDSYFSGPLDWTEANLPVSSIDPLFNGDAITCSVSAFDGELGSASASDGVLLNLNPPPVAVTRVLPRLLSGVQVGQLYTFSVFGSSSPLDPLDFGVQLTGTGCNFEWVGLVRMISDDQLMFDAEATASIGTCDLTIVRYGDGSSATLTEAIISSE